MTQINIHTLPPVLRRAVLEGARRSRKGRRIYTVDAMGPGFHPVTPAPKCVISDDRIRSVVCTLFRRVFGRAATFSWGDDGHIGEAWDDRGNRLCVRQLNDLPG